MHLSSRHHTQAPVITQSLLITLLLIGSTPALASAQDGGLFLKATGGAVVGGMAGLLVGGLAGGAVGGAAAGGNGYEAAAMVLFGGTAGFMVGSGIGAGMAVSSAEHRVPRQKMILTSTLSTLLGLGVFALIGDAGDGDSSSYRGEADYSSWNIGAAVGAVIHLSITAGVAAGDAKKGRAGGSAVSLRPLVRDGGYGAVVTWKW